MIFQGSASPTCFYARAVRDGVFVSLWLKGISGFTGLLRLGMMQRHVEGLSYTFLLLYTYYPKGPCT